MSQAGTISLLLCMVQLVEMWLQLAVSTGWDVFGGAACDGQLLGWHVSLEVSHQPGTLGRMTLNRPKPLAVLLGEGKSKSTSPGGVACALCKLALYHC